MHRDSLAYSLQLKSRRIARGSLASEDPRTDLVKLLFEHRTSAKADDARQTSNLDRIAKAHGSPVHAVSPANQSARPAPDVYRCGPQDTANISSCGQTEGPTEPYLKPTLSALSEHPTSITQIARALKQNIHVGLLLVRPLRRLCLELLR